MSMGSKKLTKYYTRDPGIPPTTTSVSYGVAYTGYVSDTYFYDENIGGGLVKIKDSYPYVHDPNPEQIKFAQGESIKPILVERPIDIRFSNDGMFNYLSLARCKDINTNINYDGQGEVNISLIDVAFNIKVLGMLIEKSLISPDNSIPTKDAYYKFLMGNSVLSFFGSFKYVSEINKKYEVKLVIFSGEF